MSKFINVRNLILASVLFAGCAAETEGDHLEEGMPGVLVERATWGIGMPTPSKFTVKPGDHIERMTRTCESGDAEVGPCRKPLDRECNDDGGIPLPDTAYRATIDDGEVVSITVTIKCRFPGGAS